MTFNLFFVQNFSKKITSHRAQTREEKPLTTIVVDEHVSESEQSTTATQSRAEIDVSSEGDRSESMLTPESSIEIAKERKKKNLFRHGSFTEWSPEMLEGLKGEMLQTLRKMRRDELSKMFTGQDELRWSLNEEIALQEVRTRACESLCFECL